MTNGAFILMLFSVWNQRLALINVSISQFTTGLNKCECRNKNRKWLIYSFSDLLTNGNPINLNRAEEQSLYDKKIE